MPSSSRPGTGRSRGTREPIVSTTASNSARSSSPVTSTPTSTPQRSSTPSSTQLVDAALDDPLLDLEVRHAEAHQAAGGLVALEERRRGGPARRSCCAAAMPAGPGRRRRRRCGRSRAPAAARTTQPSSQARSMIEFSICLIVTASPSRISRTHDGLARRGAQAAGELGEVVRRVQLGDRLAPSAAVDEVVPVRDQVAQRAAVVAERHAALHAARALGAELLVAALHEELAERLDLDALDGVLVGDARAVDLQEAADLAHQSSVSSVMKPSPPSRRRSAPGRDPGLRRPRVPGACSASTRL